MKRLHGTPVSGCFALLAMLAGAANAAPPLRVDGASFALSEVGEEPPALAGSPAGTVLAAAVRPTGGQFRGDFLARVFGRTGGLLNSFRINDEEPNRQIRVVAQTLGADGDGNFVVLWQHPGQIRAQRFSPEGNFLGASLHVNQVAAGEDDDLPILQVHADGAYDVAWFNSNRTTGRGDIGVRRVSPGNVVSAPRPVDGRVRFPAFATLRSCARGGGESILIWETANENPQPGQTRVLGIAMRPLDSEGVPVGDETLLVPAALVALSIHPSLACLSDGSFVVAFALNQAPARAGFDIVAQRFDRSGQPLGPAKLLNQKTPGDQTSPALAALDNGEFVATWVSTLKGKSTLVARRFRSSFDYRGGELRLTAPGQTPLGATRIDRVGGDGRLVVGWWQGLAGTLEGHARGLFLKTR